MPQDRDSFGIDLFVKNKRFIAFSSGPFVGWSDNQRSETYSLQPQPDSNGVISAASQYKLVSTGHEGKPFGVAAFANISTKLSRSTA